MELITFPVRMNTNEFGTYVTLILSSALSLNLGGHCLSLLIPLENCDFQLEEQHQEVQVCMWDWQQWELVCFL